MDVGEDGDAHGGSVDLQVTRRSSGRRPDEDPEVRLLAALAHLMRLAMLRQLAAEGEVCGCGFRAAVAQPTVSHHLRILRDAGLAVFERDGIYLRYRVLPDGLGRAAAIVDEFRLEAEASAGAAAGACCSSATALAPRPRGGTAPDA